MTYTQKASKYRAKKTEYLGRKFDSKFEAGVCHGLEIRKHAGEILDYECQFKVEMMPYDRFGNPLPKLLVSHKVDFRVHELDGSFTLLEAKGVETADYKWRRKWLELLWLPEHQDHCYVVVKDGGPLRYKRPMKR